MGAKFSTILSVLALLIALFSTSFATAHKTVESKITKGNLPCQLTFGWTEWMPLQYLNENGELQGIQIELIKSIAKELNCELTFKKSDWEKLIAGVKSGDIDFISDATISVERAQFANFSVPYRRDAFVIYVRTKDLDKYKENSIEQLKRTKMKLSFTSNFLYGDEIEAWQKDARYNQFLSYAENTEKNIARLFSGEIDGFLEDPYVLSYKFGRNKVPRTLSRLPITIIGHSASYMFSKKTVNQIFVERFNQALTKVKRLRRFQTNWFFMED